jgi:hypothetical protein
MSRIKGVTGMFFNDAFNAVRGCTLLVEENNVAYAIYALRRGFKVKKLIHANGMELEIIKP